MTLNPNRLLPLLEQAAHTVRAHRAPAPTQPAVIVLPCPRQAAEIAELKRKLAAAETVAQAAVDAVHREDRIRKVLVSEVDGRKAFLAKDVRTSGHTVHIALTSQAVGIEDRCR